MRTRVLPTLYAVLLSLPLIAVTIEAASSGAFVESGGLVVMEYENGSSTNFDAWSVQTGYAGYTGASYLEWKHGNDSGGVDSAGKGIITWTVDITKTGDYQLHMRSWPGHNTEHNDVWIDFPDATHWGTKGGSTISLSGWTKMYNNGGGKWGWQTTTKDHDAHQIWVTFPNPGTYTFRCSGRSTKFAVDRIALRHSSVATSTATNTATSESERGSGGGGSDGDGSVTVLGEKRQWHRVDLSMAAVHSSETADPNPFLDYRFNVDFIAPSGKVYQAPGYFAADGAGGDSGNLWRAHLNPHETGTWTYRVSFRQGTNAAVSLSNGVGSGVSPYDGTTGSFSVGSSNKSGDDFRAPDKGMLVNRGDHYLTYGGSGKPFLYTGPGIPENILGYRGFTNTTVGVGHEFTVHAAHWNSGDPDWGGGKGKALIGALNYIADQGANSLYMMSNTIGGDGQDCFPHPTTTSTKTRYDLRKLDQWDIALGHAQTKGIFLNWHLAEHETANMEYYGATSLSVERRLYFRMMNARFGHYNGLKWNIMEECEWLKDERDAQMAYLHDVDPYDHPVTYQVGGIGIAHSTYGDHLGKDHIDAGSFQGSNSRSAMFNTIQEWRGKSAATGEPWTCAWDEPQKIENDNNDDVNGYPMGRRDKMWPCLMAGGDGFMWYIQKDGGGHGFDQRIEDFTIMHNAFNWSGHIRDFLEPLPLLSMQSSMGIVSSSTGTDYTLYLPGQVYAIFNDRAGSGMNLDLSGVSGNYSVQWFDPRSGGALQTGSVTTISGGGSRDLGTAPKDTGKDWAVLVERSDGGGNLPPTAKAGATPTSGTAPLTVAFSSAGSSDGDGSIVGYSWSFGDGGSATGASPSHTYTAAGSYTAILSVTDDDGATASATVTIEVSAAPVSQGPYGGTAPALPGTIQIEDYDLGGEGVAYHDSDTTNQGGDYRSDGVDVQTCSDAGGGHNVGWTAGGEWLEYTVDVTAGGTYAFELRYASQSAGADYRVLVDGVEVVARRQPAATGGWQIWATDRVEGVGLSAGQRVIRLEFTGGGWNANWFAVTAGGGGDQRSITVYHQLEGGAKQPLDPAIAPGGASPTVDDGSYRFDDLDPDSSYQVDLAPAASGAG